MVLRFDGFWTPEGRFPRSLSFSKSALTLKPYACFCVLLAQNMRRTCCNMVVSVGPVTRLSTTLLVKPTLPLGIKKRLNSNRAGRVQMHFRWLVYRERELLKKLFLKCTHYGVICMVLRLDGFGTPEGRFPRNLSFSKSALTLKPYACFYVLLAPRSFELLEKCTHSQAICLLLTCWWLWGSRGVVPRSWLQQKFARCFHIGPRCRPGGPG